MKAFLLTLLPFIVASFVAGTPAGGVPGEDHPAVDLPGPGAELALQPPVGLAQQLLFLHQFACAVANSQEFEAELLEQLGDVTDAHAVVEVLHGLAAEDCVLHQVVVGHCCGDALVFPPELHLGDFAVGHVGDCLEVLGQFLGDLRHDALHALQEGLQHCPAAESEHFPHELLDGEFPAVEVPCQAGQFLAVDGPLGQLEGLLLGHGH